MENRITFLIKNTSILAISNFASKIMVFLMVPIYTSVLKTSEYGFYDLVISIIQCLIPIITINVIDAIMRFSMDKEYNIKNIVGVGLKYIFISYIIGIIILMISYLSNNLYIKQNIIFIGLYCFFTV